MDTKVIYTPIDSPPQPDVDTEKLKEWLRSNYVALERFRNALTGDGRTGIGHVENYPWDLTVVYFDVYDNGPGWTGTFQQDWPELAEWIPKAYGLELEDLGLIMFLPMRDEHAGVGFWHNDPEPNGLRFYAEFQGMNKNKLLMRRTKTYNKIKPQYNYPMDTEEHLQPELLECKVMSPKQVFFLNNNNSAHATYTVEPGLTRIACIVACKPSTKKKVTDIVIPLVERSAEKFKEYSLYWKDESQG